MTQEEKQLLLKDLLPRQLYGVKVHYRYYDFICGSERLIQEGDGVIKSIAISLGNPVYIDGFHVEVENVKPYLRPMSSMTEEELNECVCQSGIRDIECPNWQDIPKEKQFEARLNHSIAVFLTDSNSVDWLNAHHFDYRGLIPIGLALEAPEGMYKTEQP